MRFKKARIAGDFLDTEQKKPTYWQSQTPQVKEDFSKEPDFYDQIIINEIGKKQFAKFIKNNFEFSRKIKDELGTGYVFSIPDNRTRNWLDNKEDYKKYTEEFRRFFQGRIRTSLMLSEDFVHKYNLLSNKQAHKRGLKKYCCYCGSLKKSTPNYY